MGNQVKFGAEALMLFTDDIQGDHDRITANGVEFTIPPTDVTGSTVAQVEDNCGNLLQIPQLARW
jgi:predicted enzyme related to lactoylglutathione lyase